MGRQLQLQGKSFGSLRVLKQAPSGKGGGSRWECLCSCGKVLTVDGGCLSSGNTKSCGHGKAEAARDRFFKHGQSGSKEYWVWSGMIQRCTNKNHDAYYRYGGRGITVCERWASSFENFIKDLGHRPSDNHTLERIENDKGYMPGNVKWATKLDQGKNKCNNRLITVNGKTQHLNQWARDLGIDRTILKDRVHRKWSDEETILIPVGARRKGKRLITANGETKPIGEWAKDLGIKRNILSSRVHYGWSDEEIILIPVGVRREDWKKNNG